MCRTVGLKIGSDPELVIVDRKGNPKSAIKVLKEYSKESKLKIEDQSIFYDNVLLEMNLNPASNFDELRSNFSRCLKGTEKVLQELGDYRLKVQASLDFPEKEIDDVEAKIFGCDPEFCIYNRNEENQILRVEPPSMPDNSPFRSCGGHIHIGHVIANWELGGRPADVIKYMDGLVGICSIVLDKDPTSLARRKLYGLAGSHRITPYGVEYRTLSNFWFQSPQLMKIIYRLTRKALEWTLTNDKTLDNILSGPEVQAIINNADAKKAKEVIALYSPTLPYNLGEEILSFDTYLPSLEEWHYEEEYAAA